MRAKNMGFIKTIRKIPTRETEPRRDNVVSKIHFFRTIERINFESGYLRTNSSRTKRMRCFASQCSALSDKKLCVLQVLQRVLVQIDEKMFWTIELKKTWNG